MYLNFLKVIRSGLNIADFRAEGFLRKSSKEVKM